MFDYKNVMELLVEEQYDKVAENLGCCTCEQCRKDVIAFALNQLPAKYVVTDKGELYSKAFMLRTQHVADITAALTQGADQITKFPRH